MMKKQMQKAVCLLLGSVLLLSMGACGKKDKTSARDVTDGSSVTATQTTQVVREIKSHKGEIGEEMQYQDVDAVMKKAYVSDYTFSENGSEIGLTFFEFEITNNSEDELAVDLLSQTFGLTVDGEASAFAVRGLSIRNSVIQARRSTPRSSPEKPATAISVWKCRQISRAFASPISPELAFWTGTRHSSLTSIVRTWKLHRSRWKHSSKSLPANGLCAVLPQIQKANGRQIQMPAVFLAQNKGNTAQSLPISFACNSRKIEVLI